MEARLQPINAILGLLTPGDVNPPALFEQGFVLAGLEVPIVGSEGRVDVDIVLFHPASSHFVLLEAKSGANIEDGQAARYAGVDAAAVVQSTGISVPRRDELSLEVAYVCLAENADRIRQGLATAAMTGALIVVAQDRIEFERDGQPTELDAAWKAGPIMLAAPVVRVLSFDADSPASEFDAAVRAQLVAELSHSRPEVTVRLLAERVVPHFPIFASGVQRRLIAKVRDSARNIVEADPDTYGYLPTTGTRHEPAIELRARPETRDPRGRTQAYQALYGRRGRLEHGERRQLDLLDLLAEAADGVVSGATDNDIGENDQDAEDGLDDDESDADGEER
ncbi:MAG: hypothetical protein ACJ74U_06155 [Jatrophihabitantaceae bacterium]